MVEPHVHTSGPVAGRYRLVEVVARETNRLWWHAEDVTAHRSLLASQVALPADCDADTLRRATARVVRTSEIMRLLCPGRVAAVVDAVVEGGDLWTVAERIDGTPLSELLDRTGPFGPARAARIGLDVLDVLQAAHDEGITHGELSPGQIFVPDSGPAVVAGFGLAGTTLVPRLTAPSYASPEQARDERIGPAADLWALGAVLYTSVEGRPPFRDRGRPDATLRAVDRLPLRAPLRTGELTQAVQGLLRKNSRERLTRPVVRAALTRALDDDTAPDPAPCPSPAPAPPPAPRPGDETASGSGAAAEPWSDDAPAPGPDTAGTPGPGDASAAWPGDAHAPRTDGARPGSASAPWSDDAPAPWPGDASAAWPGDARAPRTEAAPGDGTSGSDGGHTAPRWRGAARGRLLTAVGTTLAVVTVAAAVLAATHHLPGLSGAGAAGRPGAASAPPAEGTAGRTPGRSTGPAPTTAGPAPTTAGPGPSATPGGSAAVPDGYRRYTAPEGFSVALPDGWKRLSTVRASRLVYRVTFGTGDGSPALAVTHSDRVGPDPAAVWRDDVEPQLRQLPGYQRVAGAVPTTYQGHRAADLEWLSGTGDARAHTFGRGFLLGGGQGFSLRFTTPAAAWNTAANRLALRTFLGTFRPSGG
ncbi:serine/threonine protein kinase [Streptomyces collinus]|nr:Protein kinase domain protein [Streptomyces collinus]UJA12445.1 Protein kinase domain protein [Streptomyces collinus]